MDASPKVYLAIYKIDYSKAKEQLEIEENTPLSAQELVDLIVEHLKKQISCQTSHTLQLPDGKAFIFTTTHPAPTADFIMSLPVSQNSSPQPHASSSIYPELEGTLQNGRTSLIILQKVKDDVFALTGGSGHYPIGSLAVVDFASSILTKIFERQSEAITQTGRDHLLGDIAASKTATRTKHSFQDEEEFGVITKECAVALEREHQEDLGFFPSFPYKPLNINVTSKSLKIGKALTFGEYKTLLRRLEAIDKRESKFILNNLTPAKEAGASEHDLFEVLAHSIFENPYSSTVRIIGAGTESYPWNDLYRIIFVDSRRKNEALIKQEDPLAFSEIIDRLKELNSFSLSMIRNLLSKTNLVTSVQGKPTFKDKLCAGIEATVIHNGAEFFLYRGSWYTVPESAVTNLNEKFNNLLDSGKAERASLHRSYPLSAQRLGAQNENDFNELIRKRTNIVVGHTALVNKVELADLIIRGDNSRTFLFHNKMYFDGPGARDVNGQIIAAARIWYEKLHSEGRRDFLHDYYAKINTVYERNNLWLIPRDTFCKLFDSERKLYFMAGYLGNMSKASSSTYAKLLSCDARKQLQLLDFGYCCISLA